MIKAIFTAIVFLLLTAYAHAQIIKGTIVDADSGIPIANASVYLNGTSKGVNSDINGSFILNTSERNIPLIVSCIGYQSETITNYANHTLQVALKAKQQVLREVIIGVTSREQLLKIFLTEFIGSTNKDCVIENTIDINFHYHKKTKTLEADASPPLVIYNKKLGYKIIYYLSSFKHSPEKTRYFGNYFFKEDTTGLLDRSVKKIMKDRESAYLGSRMHFIRSLWANKLSDNNYTITDTSYYSRTTMNEGFKKYGEVFYLDKRIHERDFYNFWVKAHDGEKYISQARILFINYYDTQSYLQLEDLQEALIQSDGYYSPGIIWMGEMGSQRINKLLPYEYEPPKKLPTKSKLATLEE